MADLVAIVKTVVSSLNNPVLTISSLPTILPVIMARIEAFNDLTGEQKKQSALLVVDSIIDAAPVPEEEKQALKMTINLVAPPLIDTFIGVSKGIYNLGKKAEASCMSFKCCK
jgi:hypothetical protein